MQGSGEGMKPGASKKAKDLLKESLYLTRTFTCSINFELALFAHMHHLVQSLNRLERDLYQSFYSFMRRMLHYFFGTINFNYLLLSDIIITYDSCQ